MSEQNPQKKPGHTKPELLLLLFILLIAAALRLWNLGSVPPGFTHDEAGHGHDAIAILYGDRPMYQTVGYGREPLYDYLTAGLMKLLGPTGRTLRLFPVLLSLVTLVLTYAWARLAFDGPTALTALAFQSISFWSLATSRQALRSGLLPALFAGAVYVYWRCIHSVERPRWRSVGLLALLIGATLYTYMPARVAWVAFAVLPIYLALFHRPTFRRIWRPTLASVLLGLACAVPLFSYLRAHPDAEQRLDMLNAPLQSLAQGDLTVVLDCAQSALGGLLLAGEGDTFLAYNIPGRPLFDWATGSLFVAGLFICLLRWRRPAYALALIWLLVGIGPSLITGATASFTRSIVALPVALLLPALPASAAVRWARNRWGRRAAQVTIAAIVLFIAVTGALNTRAYLVTWGQSADVRAAYQHTLVQMARHVQTHTDGQLVAVSTLYPQAPHDPYVWEMSLRQRDPLLLPFDSPARPLASPNMRWFNAQRALVIPNEARAWLAAPSSATPDAYFSTLPGFNQARIDQRPGDLDPFFSLYAWQPSVSLTALKSQASGAPLDWPLPINLGDTLQFIGYDLRAPNPQPGGNVELITLWQVTDPSALRSQTLTDELVLFSQALDGANRVVGQEDRLDAPTWNWQSGDTIAQIHRFTLHPDLPPGPLALQVGVYRRVDLSRLPVLLDGQIVDDRILLQPLEVSGP